MSESEERSVVTASRNGDQLRVTIESSSMTSDDAKTIADEIVGAFERAGAGVRAVVIDMRRVSIINSIGLGMLVAAQTTVMRHHVRVLLTGVSEFIAGVLGMTNLDQFFVVCDTEEEIAAEAAAE